MIFIFNIFIFILDFHLVKKKKIIAKSYSVIIIFLLKKV